MGWSLDDVHDLRPYRRISRHGIEKDSRIGYPVGIGYPPTWGELTCSFRQGDRTVIEPGTGSDGGP